MRTDSQILSHIDHTLLAPTAVWEDIRRVCREAAAYGTASACIPPCYIARAAGEFGAVLNLCTVIGFPLGYQHPAVKAAEAAQAAGDGASEIDMVINLTDVKNGAFDAIVREIEAVGKAAEGCLLKVIIETCYLTDGEKQELCRAVSEAGADYIKTSTGFGTQGAVLTDISLFREYLGPGVKIKAAGGVRTREDLEAFLDAGCDRIGTSSALSILGGGTAGQY